MHEDPKALEKYEKQKVKYEQKLQQAIDTAVQTRDNSRWCIRTGSRWR